MVSTEKPRSIMITIRDRKNNTSKTVTLYDATLAEVYQKIKDTFKIK